MALNEMIKKRIDLEHLIRDIKNKEVELMAYDIILHSLDKYYQSCNDDADDILNIVNDMPGLSDTPFWKYKMKSELMEWKQKYGHSPAYIFVINYEANNINHSKHIYRPNLTRECVGRYLKDKEIIPELEQLGFEDNAILVDTSGIINGTEAMLVNVNPADIKDEKWLNGKSIYGHGFLVPVHSRHNSSIGGSYHIDNAVIYTLGESGIIRRFYRGFITFSTHTGENEIVKKRVHDIMTEK